MLAEVDLDPEPTFTIDTRNRTLNETVRSLREKGVETTHGRCRARRPCCWCPPSRARGRPIASASRTSKSSRSYNRSVRYAMAVNDLAQAIALRVRGTPALSASTRWSQ